MDLGLSGRVFLVTGGTDGLGLAAARTLVAEGARVVVSSRSEDKVKAAVAGLGGNQAALGLAADLGDAAAPERLVAMAVAAFGRLDGALVSSGGPAPGNALQVSDGAWREAFETEFLGALRVVRATSAAITPDPMLRSGAGGAIVVNLSTSAREPITGLSMSNGLRPGLAGLVKDLGDELGPAGIRIVGLVPGHFATERMVELDSLHGNPEAVRRQKASLVPLQRYGDPEEYGRVAAFLLSPAASYITGSLVSVEGGRLRSL